MLELTYYVRSISLYFLMQEGGRSTLTHRTTISNFCIYIYICDNIIGRNVSPPYIADIPAPHNTSLRKQQLMTTFPATACSTPSPSPCAPPCTPAPLNAPSTQRRRRRASSRAVCTTNITNYTFLAVQLTLITTPTSCKLYVSCRLLYK